jgi:hypothetical protein
MATEWWYDNSFIDFRTIGVCDQELFLIRLTVSGSGSAELLFPDGRTKRFGCEMDARLWLGDEEYRRLTCLVQDFLDDGRRVDPRIRVA